MKNLIIEELQFITGIITDDLDYLVFKLLEKSGSLRKEQERNVKTNNYQTELTHERIMKKSNESVDDWFNKFEEIQDDKEGL